LVYGLADSSCPPEWLTAFGETDFGGVLAGVRSAGRVANQR